MSITPLKTHFSKIVNLSKHTTTTNPFSRLNYFLKDLLFFILMPFFFKIPCKKPSQIVLFLYFIETTSVTVHVEVTCLPQR